MSWQQWQKKKLQYKDVLKEITGVLRRQNQVEVDKVELVMNDDRIYHKAYSEKMKPVAAERNLEMDMQRITKIVAFGKTRDMMQCGRYRKLMEKKQREHRHQIFPYVDMEPDPEIAAWLEKWELRDKWGENPIKLSDRQLLDTNLTLQKRYSYLQWSQGAGKTVSGTAQGMYRLAHGQTDYVFVVSSAISIETTWAPFLEKYRIPHKVVRCRADLRRVYAHAAAHHPQCPRHQQRLPDQ